MRVGLYDVFAAAPFRGNQAVVVRSTDGLESDAQLLALAQEFMVPETVISVRRDGRLRLRFATADRIIARCGHGTLAAVADAVLTDWNAPLHGAAGQYEADGHLAPWTAVVHDDNSVRVSVAWPDLPTRVSDLPEQLVLEGLQIDANDLDRRMPFLVYDCGGSCALPDAAGPAGSASCTGTGNRNALVPLKSIDALLKVRCHWNKLEELFAVAELTDLHVYVADALVAHQPIHVRCRNVFPYGVREEAATGTASISLTGALMQLVLARNDRVRDTSFHFHQGIGSRRGLIHVRWHVRDDGTPEIWVDGMVFRMMKGDLLHSPEAGANHD